MGSWDCPFVAVDQAMAEMPDDVNAVLVDMHAEATSEKWVWVGIWMVEPRLFMAHIRMCRLAMKSFTHRAQLINQILV